MNTLDKPFHEEHQVHGFIYLEDMGLTLYGDGATMSGQGIASVMKAPPKDAFERACAVRSYCVAALRIATKRFTHLADSVQAHLRSAEQTGNPPPDAATVIPKLQELRRAVDEARAGLEKAEAEVLANESPTVKRQRENREKNRVAREEFASALRVALKE